MADSMMIGENITFFVLHLTQAHTSMVRHRIRGSHILQIEIEGEETSNEWLETVTEEEYQKLK